MIQVYQMLQLLQSKAPCMCIQATHALVLKDATNACKVQHLSHPVEFQHLFAHIHNQAQRSQPTCSWSRQPLSWKPAPHSWHSWHWSQGMGCQFHQQRPVCSSSNCQKLKEWERSGLYFTYIPEQKNYAGFKQHPYNTLPHVMPRVETGTMYAE